MAQGTENTGKVLGINASGNVEPITVSGGGTVSALSSLNGLKNGDVVLITSLSIADSSFVVNQFFGIYKDSCIYGWGVGSSSNFKRYISLIQVRSSTALSIFYQIDGDNAINNYSNGTIKSVSGIKITF